jgi:hypothetical protein
MKRYELQFWEDHRGTHGHSFILEIDENDQEETINEFSRGEFDIPISEKGEVRFFLVYENGCELTVKLILSEPESMFIKPNTILLQIHSFINDCGPFETAGYTTSYKEIGKYPDGIKVTNKNILNFKIPQDIAKPAIAIQVDSNGIIMDSLSILPFA